MTRRTPQHLLGRRLVKHVDELRNAYFSFGGAYDMSGWTRRSRSVARLAAWFLLLLVPSVAAAQGTWEMRVCADPDNLPASNRERTGFDNRIAEILAEELRAELTYVWDRAGPLMVENNLWPGECDIVMSVSEGASGLLNTVAYYQAPFVFVYRKSSDFEVNSLDQENLQGLRIGTYPNSAPHRAVGNLGLSENVSFFPPATDGGRANRDRPIVEAILANEIDVGILYGPSASYAARGHADELEIVPVSPQIVPPMLQMSRIWTMGVRPGDEALRDRLNIALASRWDDIQAVFDDARVPTQPLPAPRPPAPPTEEVLRLGVVLPIPTGRGAATDEAARAARTGAVLAEDLANRDTSGSVALTDVLVASAPSVDAALRAARRLVALEGASALVGGLGEGQAQALNRLAGEWGVVFFNVGSVDPALRAEECRATTFNIEASADMYLDAIAAWSERSGSHRWFVVHEDTAQGVVLHERAREAIIDRDDARVVGTAAVPSEPSSYHEQFARIEESGADAVLVLLEPTAQEMFLSQYQREGLEAAIVGFPFPFVQTRQYLARLRQAAPNVGKDQRAALWDARLEAYGADELNERFASRSGQPMDPSGWAAYAAVTIARQAADAAGSTAPPALGERLLDPAAVFEVRKGPGTAFRSSDHQLVQPLYLVEIDPDAEWGRQVSRQVELVRVAGQVPDSDAREEDYLDRLGRLGRVASSDSARCGS